jgi:hypothetical protein
MNFIWIIIISLIGGIFFAAIAAWLSTRKGNTISDILNSQKFSEAEAIKIEIFNKIKLTSNIPIVGLYVVAAIVAIGLPAFYFWQLQQEVTIISLSGQVEKDQSKKVYVAPKEMGIEESGTFEIPIVYTNRRQTINFESPYYSPLTLSISIDKQNNRISVYFSNSELQEEEIALQPGVRNYQILQKIPLFPSAIPVTETVANTPSEMPEISPELPTVESPGASRETPLLSPERR